jgi:hypothetical protein
VYIQIFGKDGSYIQLATFPHPKKEEVVVKLPLDPPLKSGFEARPLLFRWKKEAFAKYNVVSGTPSRDGFSVLAGCTGRCSSMCDPWH